MRPNPLLEIRNCEVCEVLYAKYFRSNPDVFCAEHERYYYAYWTGLSLAVRLGMELDE